MKTSVNLGYLVFLSAVASPGISLYGYDPSVVSRPIARVPHRFGLDTLQQGWYIGCAWVGSIAGVFFLRHIRRFRTQPDNCSLRPARVRAAAAYLRGRGGPTGYRSLSK